MPNKNEGSSYTPNLPEAKETTEAMRPDIQEYIKKDAKEILSAEDTKRIAEKVGVDVKSLEGIAAFQYLGSFEGEDNFFMMFVKDGRVFETVGDLEKIGIERSEFASQLKKYGYDVGTFEPTGYGNLRKLKAGTGEFHPFWMQAERDKVLKRRPNDGVVPIGYGKYGRKKSV